MMRRLAPMFAGLFALAVGLAPEAGAQSEGPVPQLERRVTDLTGTLSVDERAALEAKLAAFEARKGSQIAVLFVPTTGPETIEQYAIRVAERWRLGREGVDDGALLLVARDDRALRIEVGYGLEGAMPDAIANRIVEDIVVPRFRLGEFDAGVNAGVDAMIRVIDGEPLPAVDPPAAWPSGGLGEGLGSLFVVGFMLVMVVGSILRALFGRFPAALLTGGLTGAIVWVLVASALAAAVVAALAFVFTLLGGMPGQRRGGYRRGGWGGWSTMGGGGRGGWSGGGGGFGGGGASGRW